MMSETTSKTRRAFTMTFGTKTEFELHAYRCPHIRRNLRQRIESIKVASSTDNVERMISDFTDYFVDEELQDQGFAKSDVRVMDCAHNAPIV